MKRISSLVFCVLFSLLFVSLAFSQGFTRTIELKNPRMNGQDVVNLQRRLLALGFSSVGEADGYYGPLSTEVIKNVQTFSGFDADGKVNKVLWDYIFNDTNSSFLKHVSTVLAYNPEKLMKSRDFLYVDDSERQSFDIGGEAFVYYSSTDKKAKILEYYFANSYIRIEITCYFISDNYYFVKNSYTHPEVNENLDFVGSITEETTFVFNNNTLYEMNSGNMRRTEKTPGGIVGPSEPVQYVLDKFISEYGR